MGSPLLLFGLPALGIYALTSHCLRKRPHLLHRPRKFPIRCRHASHRGGSGERIENTLEAFSHAQSQGTNLLELDCHLTRDGVVVVSHDNNLERQTGHNINISETNYEDLPLYKDRLEVTFAPGCYSHGSDHHIPRLEDVLQKFPGLPINIEIKEDNDELIQKVADLIRQYDRSNISIWASFDEEVLKKCCAANKEMPYIFSVKRGITILLLYYVGLLPFIPLKESFLEFFLPSIMNRTYFPVEKGYCGALLAKFTHKVTMRKKLFKHLEDRGIQEGLTRQHTLWQFSHALIWWRDIHITAASQPQSVLSSRFLFKKTGTATTLLQTAHVTTALFLASIQLLPHSRRGNGIVIFLFVDFLEVLLWVLNEEKDFEEAFNYGVTGVMTDYPSSLRKYLDSHPPLLNE